MNDMIRNGELSDAQLDNVVGGGVWGWIKDKARDIKNTVQQGATAAANWIADKAKREILGKLLGRK